MKTDTEIDIEIDKENTIRALKGEDLIRTCISCDHYQKSIFWSEAECVRRLTLSYHPVTGKKEWLGDIWSCVSERGHEGRQPPGVEPCGPSGVHWVKSKGERLIFFQQRKT